MPQKLVPNTTFSGSNRFWIVQDLIPYQLAFCSANKPRTNCPKNVLLECLLVIGQVHASSRSRLCDFPLRMTEILQIPRRAQAKNKKHFDLVLKMDVWLY